MYLGDRLEGYLYLDAQVWQLTEAGRAVAEEREMLEWMVVWESPGEGPPYRDDVAYDTEGLLEELDADRFLLRARGYVLVWVTGEERREILQRRFGIEPT
ncbi:hypothetical protein Q6346_14670 [Isoptericola sp. b490]|uniref:hypothetical protein n=1 Tax=Actinotalea lenta TaxID=3064654 RepID=UPI002713892C|nr:hypothetical protein [Isoptericola sp. b490]MDO8122552.1 hypothetical protein [Isoptericola sp. b490]